MKCHVDLFRLRASVTAPHALAVEHWHESHKTRMSMYFYDLSPFLGGNKSEILQFSYMVILRVKISLYDIMWVKKSPQRTCGNFSKTDGNFSTKFYTPIMRSYLRQSPNFYSKLTATLTKLCHIKRDHSVHIIGAKCPPSAETHAGIFWHFIQIVSYF